MRRLPNIIITGTPGTGKTTHCEMLVENAIGGTASNTTDDTVSATAGEGQQRAEEETAPGQDRDSKHNGDEPIGLRHMSVNQIVKDRECHDGWDAEYKCWIVDEDKLLDSIEEEVKEGGWIIDWHACDLFPESWIDLVVVLRANSTVLYDRLKARNYPEAKLQDNLDSEIMEVLLEEAREAYDEEIVIELQSDEVDQIESNVDRILQWVEQWKKDHADDVSDNDEQDDETDLSD